MHNETVGELVSKCWMRGGWYDSKRVLMGPLRGDEIAFFDNDIITLVDMEGHWLAGREGGVAGLYLLSSIR